MYMDGALVFWVILFLTLLGVAIYVMLKQRAYKQFGIIVFLVSLIPTVLVATDCYKNSSSEACVWGQSLFLLYLAGVMFCVAPIIFLIYCFAKSLRGRQK